jgi:hypothetical protein
LYQPINGWTKETILAKIESDFTVKSKNGEYCQLRGLNGAKCAVGIFIPDDLYAPDMEEQVVYELFDTAGLRELMPLNARAMVAFQRIHDEAEDANVKADLINWVQQKVT